MDNIIYRKMNCGDIDDFIELRINQLIEEGAGGEPNITNALKNYYQKHLNDCTFFSWLAVCDDKIIATSGISFVEVPPHFGNPSGKTGIVSSMYTLGEYRRRGLARSLMNLIIDEAKEYGCGIIQITPSKAGACFYESCGFKRYTNYYRYKL